MPVSCFWCSTLLPPPVLPHFRHNAKEPHLAWNSDDICQSASHIQKTSCVTSLNYTSVCTNAVSSRNQAILFFFFFCILLCSSLVLQYKDRDISQLFFVLLRTGCITGNPSKEDSYGILGFWQNKVREYSDAFSRWNSPKSANISLRHKGSNAQVFKSV